MTKELSKIDPQTTDLTLADGSAVPSLVASAGPNARYAWEEFASQFESPHTRRAYVRAAERFLTHVEDAGAELATLTPSMVRSYLDGLELAPSSKKLHLAAVRKFLNFAVLRHAVMINPAEAVRGPRVAVVEGKTPATSVEQARELLASMDVSSPIRLRDRAAIATLIYTACRISAVSKLNRDHFYHTGQQHTFHFDEKGGKSREIPVRHDLETYVLEYLDARPHEAKPLFVTAVGKTGLLSDRRMSTTDIHRMIKRRLAEAGLPLRLSAHSFRAGTVTDLLEQGVPLDDVQYLVGHADPRTTKLYDRRKREVTRNIVERISV